MPLRVYRYTRELFPYKEAIPRVYELAGAKTSICKRSNGSFSLAAGNWSSRPNFRQASKRLCNGPLWRYCCPRGSRHEQGNVQDHGLFPADGGLRGTVLCRWQDQGITLHQARRTSFG